MSLLGVIHSEQIDQQRRTIAAGREHCDYCGEPFRTGNYGDSYHGGGWGRQRLMLRIGSRWFALCSDECRNKIWDWHQSGIGEIPWYIGHRDETKE